MIYSADPPACGGGNGSFKTWRFEMAKQKVQSEEQQEDEAPRYTREAAARKVVAEIDGETTLGDLVKEAERLIVNGGGKPNPDSTEAYVWGVLETAESLGVVELINTVRRIKK
jgi:hypothetical protein